MIQRCSFLGLYFSVLVSAENSILNNVLQCNRKPINLNSVNSTAKMKTAFLNKEFININPNVYNFNTTKKQDKINSSITNQLLPGQMAKLINLKPVNRFPRQISSHINRKGDISKHIKVLLNLQSQNKGETYDLYDYGKYDNYQKRNIDGLADADYNLNRGIENNSQPITRTLSESQNRKRCIRKNMRNLGSKKIQSPQKLRLENIEDRRKSIITCRDCKCLKSNRNPVELKNSLDNNLRLKKNNDDYLINVLKQLIDKLNNSNNLRTTYYKDILVQRCNELASLENKSVEQKITNISPEEDLLKIEKMEENRITGELNSSLENTFMNENGVKNYNNSFRPFLNNLKSKFNVKSISKSDKIPSNLKNTENQDIETNDDNNFNNLQIIDTTENKEVLTSPLPEENGVFEGTVKPLYVSTPPTADKRDSTAIDKHGIFTTNVFGNQSIDDDHFSNNYKNNINQDKSSEPLDGNSFQISPILESNEQSELNALRANNSDGILEYNIYNNDDKVKINNSEQMTIEKDPRSVENENNSLKNSENYNYNTKDMKNILSSIMINNITEIKTDKYASSNNVKIKSYKRSDKSQITNTEIDSYTNINDKINKLKEINNLNLDLLKKNQITYKHQNKLKHNTEEPKLTMLQEPKLVIHGNRLKNTKGNKINSNTKKLVKIVSSKDIIPSIKFEHLELVGQRKNNHIENIDNKMNIKKLPLTSKNLAQESSRQFVEKLKQHSPKEKNTSIAHTLEKFNNVNKIDKYENIFTTPESSALILKEVISQSTPRNIAEGLKDYTIHNDNITKNISRKINTKLKHDFPINSNTHILNAIIIKSPPKNKPKESRKHTMDVNNITTMIPRKIITKLKYDEPKNSNKTFLNTYFISKTSPRNKVNEFRDHVTIDDNNIKKKILRKINIKLKHGVPTISNTQILNKTISKTSPNNQPEESKEHTIYGNNISTMIPRQINIKLKHDEPKNSNAKVLNKILSKTSPRNLVNKLRDHEINNDNIIKKIPRKMNTELKHNIPKNSNTHIVRHFIGYNNGDDVSKKLSYSQNNLSQAPLKTHNNSVSQILSQHPKKNVQHWGNNVKKKSSVKSITEPRKIPTLLNLDTQIERNLKRNMDLDSVKLRKSPSLRKKSNNNIFKNIYENNGNTKSTKISSGGKNSIKSMKINNIVLKSKKSTPMQSIQTSKTKTISSTTSPTVNKIIFSKSKLQKKLNDSMVKDKLSFLHKRRPNTEYDFLGKPFVSSKHKNTLNDRSFTKTDFIQNTRPKSNLKFKFKLDSNLLLKSKFSKVPETKDLGDDYEHAPYNAEYLEPIIFDKFTEKPILPDRNDTSQQILFGNQLRNAIDSKPLQTVREHNGHYNTEKNNSDETNVGDRRHRPRVNDTLNHDLTNGDDLDYVKHGVKSLHDISLNKTAFEMRSPEKVINSVFDVPLVGHTSRDNNGSAYIYDVLIPIEKSDGEHSELSLTKLLTGDFNLLNEHDGRSLAVEPTSDTGQTLSSARVSKDGMSSNVTDILFDNKALRILRTNKEDGKLSAPINIIQIINNGLCPNTHNRTKNALKSKSNEVNLQKVQYDDKVVSCIRSHNTPNNEGVRRRFENAYDHFDSEILDRFLQVYAPPV